LSGLRLALTCRPWIKRSSGIGRSKAQPESTNATLDCAADRRPTRRAAERPQETHGRAGEAVRTLHERSAACRAVITREISAGLGLRGGAHVVQSRRISPAIRCQSRQIGQEPGPRGEQNDSGPGCRGATACPRVEAEAGATAPVAPVRSKLVGGGPLLEPKGNLGPPCRHGSTGHANGQTRDGLGPRSPARGERALTL